MPHKIRIGGMSTVTTVAGMEAAFRSYGTIVTKALDLDGNGVSTGVGHIEYTTAQAGTNAIAAKNGATLDGAVLEVVGES